MQWAEQLFLCGAAFSRLLLRCLRGRLRILFQKVVRKSVWAVWGNSYLTGLHLELLKKKTNKKSPQTQNCCFSFVTPKHKAIRPGPTLMGMITFLVSVIRFHESAGLVCPSAPGTTLQGFSPLRHRCTPPSMEG